MSRLFFALTELNVVVGPILAAVEAGTLTRPGPWRPSEWDRRTALTAITIPATGAPAAASVVPGLPGASAPQGSPAQVYIFDAILKTEHGRTLRRTEHPIQTSASTPVATVTDHAYRMPARVTLEIGMSDAMASYTPGAWSGSASKSVSAYQALVELQRSRTLVTLTTRLDTYSNMLLEAIETSDSAKTLHGLRASIVFSEVFLASVTAVQSGNIVYGPVAGDDHNDQALPARPQTTGATPLGTLQAGPPPAAIAAQHRLPVPPASLPKVPGAGLWSSRNIKRVLGGLLG